MVLAGGALGAGQADGGAKPTDEAGAAAQRLGEVDHPTALLAGGGRFERPLAADDVGEDLGVEHDGGPSAGGAIDGRIVAHCLILVNIEDSR